MGAPSSNDERPNLPLGSDRSLVPIREDFNNVTHVFRRIEKLSLPLALSLSLCHLSMCSQCSPYSPPRGFSRASSPDIIGIWCFPTVRPDEVPPAFFPGLPQSIVYTTANTSSSPPKGMWSSRQQGHQHQPSRPALHLVASGLLIYIYIYICGSCSLSRLLSSVWCRSCTVR